MQCIVFSADMKIIGISDLHGRFSAQLLSGLPLAEADVVVISGDITNFGGEGEAAAIIDEIRSNGPQVLAVGGNCDPAEVDAYLARAGYSLDGRCVRVGKYCFLGFSGALGGSGATPHELMEEEIKEALRRAALEAPSMAQAILVCHQPPIGTKVDVIGPDRHAGSLALREFILKQRPIMCFSGHIHGAAGIDMLGATTLVNPGPLFKGGYVVADLDGSSCRVEARRIAV